MSRSRLIGVLLVVGVAAGLAGLLAVRAGGPGRRADARPPSGSRLDVNGDGLADVLVIAPGDPHRPAGPQVAYVVFGKRDDSAVDLGALGAHGMRIGGSFDDGAMIGDVNGDGLADVALFGSMARAAERAQAGRAWVVFGRRSGGAVDVDRLGNLGLQIDGPQRGAHLQLLPTAGDVDGDGARDLVAETDLPHGRALLTVLGGPLRGGRLDVRRASAPLRIRLVEATDDVAVAGDADGDGRDDIVVGDSGWRDPDFCDIVTCEGRAWLVYGAHRRRVVDLARPGHGALTIANVTNCCSALTADAVEAGDVDGDRRADVILSAEDAEGDGGYSLFLLDGARRQRPVLQLSEHASGVRWLHGPRDAVWAVGDVDGDGTDDFATGPYQLYDDSPPAPICLLRGRPWAARTVVRFSPPCMTTALHRPPHFDRDVNIARAGDVNGDGLDDILVEFDDAVDDSLQLSAWYVLFGSAHPSPVPLTGLHRRGFAISR
jgi:FG-GAP repeat